jgi:hypothetical protein
MTPISLRRVEAERGPEEETPMPLTPEALLNQIQSIDEKHDDAHRRLREGLRDTNAEVEAIKKKQAEANEKFSTFAATPPDVMKLRFTPSTVVAVVAVCVSIVGGFWASTSGLRSDFRDMATRMETQQQVDTAYRKLQEERSTSFKEALDGLRRQQELQRYETQSVKDLVGALSKERVR